MVIFWAIFLSLFGIYLIFFSSKEKEVFFLLLGIFVIILSIYQWLHFFMYSSSYKFTENKKAVIFLVPSLGFSDIESLSSKGALSWIHTKPSTDSISSIVYSKNIFNKEKKNIKEKNNLFHILKKNNLSVKIIHNKESLIKPKDQLEKSNDFILDQKPLQNINNYIKKEDCAFIEISSEYFKQNISLIKDFIDNHQDILIMIITVNSNSFSPFYLNTDSVSTLTSDSTNRDALITNLDIAPTILSFFKIDMPYEFHGSIIKPIDSVQPLPYYYDKWNMLYFIRYTCLLTWIIFALLYVFYNYALFGYILFVFPSIGILCGQIFENPILYIVIWMVFSFLISFLLSKKKTSISLLKKILKLNLLLFLISIFLFPYFLYDSPFGYNNLLQGGRFYGVNNDFMGILIATGMLLGNIYNHENKKINSILLYISIFIALTPSFGANTGGSLTILFVISLYIFEHLNLFYKMNIQKYILLLFTILFIQFALGLVDYYLNSSTGHLGKFMYNLLKGNFQYDILLFKIKQIFLLFILPPWNILFFIVIIKIKNLFYSSNFVKTSLFTAFFAAFFNDTGIISAVFILFYSYVYLNTIKSC